MRYDCFNYEFSVDLVVNENWYLIVMHTLCFSLILVISRHLHQYSQSSGLNGTSCSMLIGDINNEIVILHLFGMNTVATKKMVRQSLDIPYIRSKNDILDICNRATIENCQLTYKILSYDFLSYLWLWFCFSHRDRS